MMNGIKMKFFLIDFMVLVDIKDPGFYMNLFLLRSIEVVYLVRRIDSCDWDHRVDVLMIQSGTGRHVEGCTLNIAELAELGLRFSLLVVSQQFCC